MGGYRGFAAGSTHGVFQFSGALGGGFSGSAGFRGLALELQLLLFFIDLQHLGWLAHRRSPRRRPRGGRGHRAGRLNLLGRRLGGLLVASTGHETSTDAQRHTVVSTLNPPFRETLPMERNRPNGSRRLEELAWPQLVQAASQPGSTVVWPFGAFEQHGPQLPLGTDALFADRLLDAVLAGLAEELPIWRLPPQHLGFSPEHQSFQGTLSLPAELLIRQIEVIGAQLADAGFERLVLFNGHGGQIALLQVAARQLRGSRPQLAVLPCFLWSGPEGVGELIPEPERSQGLHAGLAETSLMLHLAPELVGPERPVDGLLLEPPPLGWSLEGAVPEAWLTADLSSSGVVGDSRGASAELGEALQERLVRGWQALLTALLQSSWPPRAAKPAGERG